MKYSALISSYDNPASASTAAHMRERVSARFHFEGKPNHREKSKVEQQKC